MAGARIACVECDRDDYDGTSITKAVRDGWKDIGKEDCVDDQIGCWWTHTGTCPDCVAEQLIDEGVLFQADG